MERGIFICMIRYLFLINTAKIENNLAVVIGQQLELVVRCEHNNDIGLLVCLFIIGELKDAVGIDIGLNHKDIVIVYAVHHIHYNLLRGRLAQIVDIGFKCKSHHSHAGLATLLELELEHLVLHLLGTPQRFVVVDVASHGNHLGLGRIIGCDEIGIDGNAVTTNAASGLQNVHTGMFIGKVDEFPYIDTSLVADERQFVGESNLHITRRILGELAHLSCLAICAVQCAGNKLAVELHGLLG